MAKYFVAYAYFLKNGGHGFGNIEADRSWPIAGQDDINELTVNRPGFCRGSGV